MRRPTKGDKVKIVNRLDCRCGQTGTIIKDDYDSVPFLVKFKDGSEDWFPKRSVELIEESAAPSSKFKVGDKVRIKSREWYEANKNRLGDVGTLILFTRGMTPLCGKTFKISEIGYNEAIGAIKYKLDGAEEWAFSEDMFEPDAVEVGNIVTQGALVIARAFGIKNKPNISVNLINTHELLTNIKLD